MRVGGTINRAANFMRGRIVWVTTGVGVNFPLKTLPLSLGLSRCEGRSTKTSHGISQFFLFFCLLSWGRYHQAYDALKL